MNIRGRVDRLERVADQATEVSMPDAWNAPLRQWHSSCICFPYKPSFANECEVEVATALKCPLHGDRFNDYEVGYRAEWLPKDAQYAHAPDHVKPQFKKAWLATFPLGYLPVRSAFKNGKWFCKPCVEGALEERIAKLEAK